MQEFNWQEKKLFSLHSGKFKTIHFQKIIDKNEVVYAKLLFLRCSNLLVCGLSFASVLPRLSFPSLESQTEQFRFDEATFEFERNWFISWLSQSLLCHGPASCITMLP